MYGFYSLAELVKLTQNLLHILDTTPREQVPLTLSLALSWAH